MTAAKGAIQRMAKKKIKGTRILAAVLTAAMVFTQTPYTALAAESEAGFVTVQNETEQTGQTEYSIEAGQVDDVSGDVGDVSGGAGDISGNNGETGDVSDGNGETGDVSGPDSEASVSANDITVYGAAATTTGTLTVEGNSGSYSYDAENDVITVKNGAELTFHSADGYGAENPSQTRIYVEKDANATITLDGVYIDVNEMMTSPLEIAEDSTGAVSVVLKGSNALTAGEQFAGINKSGTAEGTLTISGSGALIAKGGYAGAGIGSGNDKAASNITISGGVITATGGSYGAGIGGGGCEGTGSNITISGGIVTATGGSYGAGIGGSSNGSGSNITISGGTVTATGGRKGAGIGGGDNGEGSNITISGGVITATGGSEGAGIGGGYYDSGSNITISGGVITATGSEGGAGIGGGYYGSGSNITITGGEITAVGSKDGAGIGGGYNGEGKNITISGGVITATGGGTGAGIGGGYHEAGQVITISGGVITATGGENAAGIGGGYYGSGSNITISGGTVIATGAENGADIGAGEHGSSYDVIFTGGSVKATTGALTGVTNGTDAVYCTVVDLTEEYGTEAAVTNVSETAYGMKDVMTDADGKIYMYLPAGEISIVFGTHFYSGTVSAEDGTENLLTRGTECKYDLKVVGDPAYYNRDEDSHIIQIKDGANLTIKSADGYGKDNYSLTRIRIETNASVTLTLDGAYIDTAKAYGGAPILISNNSTGNVDIILKGENVLIAADNYAGIQKNGDAENIGTLTISGDGSLTAKGGKNGAGIGGGYNGAGSNITISGGTVTATGGYSGAGIGGGAYGAGSNITIREGTVTATAVADETREYSQAGAGIGGGINRAGSNISISGGTVTAVSTAASPMGVTGAGIGGGSCRDGNNISISGGTVIATSSATSDGGYSGAGIGGGDCGNGRDITISGGTVIATSSVIGEEGYSGAGIGGGDSGNGSNITISGGTVTAIASASGYSGEGIGNGSRDTNESIITVTGGNIKTNSSGEISDADGNKVYPTRVDLLPLFGKNALIGNVSVQTYNTETGKTENREYNLKDTYTLGGYLYMYLPVNDKNTVTRLVFENAVYEATVGALAYNGSEYNDFTLKSSTDGKAEYGDVLREDMPEDGIIPDGIWMAGLQADGYTYTGKAITPSFRVYDGKKMLAVKKDYTVSYKNNINAATADDAKKAPTITVKSTGNYKGTETYTFTIQPVSLSAGENAAEHTIEAGDLYLAAPTGKNPKGIKAVPVVTDNGKKLSENKDYTVNHVTLNEQNAENKNANSYVNPGKYIIEIVGKGNYTGTRQITVTLADVAKEQILMSKVAVAKIPDVTYDASLCEGYTATEPGMTPALTVTYGSGKNKVTLYKEGDVNAAGETVSAENADYTVTWLNNKQAGTATVVLTGTGKILEDGTVSGQYFGEKRVTFKIKGVALSANMVNWVDGSKSVSVVYNGEEQTPRVNVSLQKKVKDENGKTVTKTTYLREYDDYYKVGDYKVSYLKNVDAGTATVVITGVNGYTGTVKKTFKITPADLTAEGTEAKIAAADSIPFVRNGAKPAIVVTAKLANGKTVTLTEGKDYTVTYANNKAVSEGKNLTEKKLPLITVKGKGNFKGSIKQTFTITNKSLADAENPITVTVADVPANKNKGKFVSKPVVTDENGTKLKENTDYKLSYSLLTETGAVELDTKTGIVNEPGSTVRITITGAGNYQGEGSVLTADYRITEFDFTKVTVKVVPKTLPYTTKPVTLTEEDLILTMKVGTGRQAVVEELKLITDGDDTKDGYKIIGYKNNVNKGTAQVTLQGCGKYGGTKTVKFYIGTRPFFWWIMP